MHSTYRSQKLVMLLSTCEIEPLLVSSGRIKGERCDGLGRLYPPTNHPTDHPTNKTNLLLNKRFTRPTLSLAYRGEILVRYIWADPDTPEGGGVFPTRPKPHPERGRPVGALSNQGGQ